MPLNAMLMQELEMEAQTTRRLLERVPEGRMDWRPHPRSRTLGELAMHIATVPAAVAALAAQASPAQVPDFADPPPPARAADFAPLLDETIAQTKRTLAGMDDPALTEIWRLMRGERELMALPRAAFLRAIMLNHWYHHRGQLSVYLRELDVPIPSIYGPSADENPFA